jgi:hypothetical protein
MHRKILFEEKTQKKTFCIKSAKEKKENSKIFTHSKMIFEESPKRTMEEVKNRDESKCQVN